MWTKKTSQKNPKNSPKKLSKNPKKFQTISQKITKLKISNCLRPWACFDEKCNVWKNFEFSGSQKICEDCCKDPDHQDAPYFHGQFMKQTGKWVFPRRGYFGKGKF